GRAAPKARATAKNESTCTIQYSGAGMRLGLVGNCTTLDMLPPDHEARPIIVVYHRDCDSSSTPAAAGHDLKHGLYSQQIEHEPQGISHQHYGDGHAHQTDHIIPHVHSVALLSSRQRW